MSDGDTVRTYALGQNFGDPIERTHRELAGLFDAWALRYRPEMFGIGDRIAGPPLTQAECRLIRLALIEIGPLREQHRVLDAPPWVNGKV